MKSHRRAFTLVELLVVIGVIALLISILLPALNKAKKQAQKVQCMSNIRQCTLAVILYADSNQGTLPYNSIAALDKPHNWYEKVNDTVNNTPLKVGKSDGLMSSCPFVSSEGWTGNGIISGAGLTSVHYSSVWHYPINQYLRGERNLKNGVPTMTKPCWKIEKARKVLLLADGCAYNNGGANNLWLIVPWYFNEKWNYQVGTWSSHAPWPINRPGMDGSLPYGEVQKLHAGFYSGSYVDGHVEALTSIDVTMCDPKKAQVLGN